MRFFMLFVANGLLAYGAFAAPCRVTNASNIPTEIRNEKTFVVGPNFIDLPGQPTPLMKTSNADDWRIRIDCPGSQGNVIRLNQYSRIKDIQMIGGSYFWANLDGDAKGEVQFSAVARSSGASSSIAASYNFYGEENPTDFNGVYYPKPISSSVCGQDFQIDVNFLNASVETRPDGIGSTGRIYVESMRVNFEPVSLDDMRCSNRPNASSASSNEVVANGQVIELVSVAAEKCVDVKDAAMWSSADIQSWECLNPDHQRFRVIKHPDSISPQALHSNQCLTIGGGEGHNGARTTQTADCYSQATKLVLAKGSHRPNSYLLRSMANGKCLDLPNGDRTNGTPLQQWECVGTPWQEWWINIK